MSMSAETRPCVDTKPHPSHIYGRDVVVFGYLCEGIKPPPLVEAQCRNIGPHLPHEWTSSVKNWCKGINLTAEEWITRLDSLIACQGERETCFCDPGWHDRECPVHNPEESYVGRLKAYSVLAVPVLIEEIKRLRDFEDDY